MNKKLLGLIPKRYLCPYCGEWHKWELSHELGHYDFSYCSAILECEKQPAGCRKMDIFFEDGCCHYKTVPTCIRGNLKLDGKISYEDIVESSEQPRVTFTVPFTAANRVNRNACAECLSQNKCLMCRLGDENNSRNMNITLGFEFEQSDYEQFASHQQPQVKEKKEDTTMANNLLNMNMEFGPNQDENIASTIMGIAVKNGDSWRIYDKKKKEITDVGDMQLGNLPIFIMPTTKLSEGDLIKDAGEYYFVTKVATTKTPTQTLSARTGEIKSVVPIKNILGFSCYSKVIALSDSLSMSDDFDMEKLVIMSAMCGQTGENSGQMNQLLPLMLFKDKIGEDDDTMKLLLMSSMMGGNMGGSNNVLMSYLMLDTFMGKKEDKIPQNTNEETAK